MTKDALNEIVATMGACKGWFDGARAGADLVAMAKLVIALERDHADKAKREKFEARHRLGDDAS